MIKYKDFKQIKRVVKGEDINVFFFSRSSKIGPHLLNKTVMVYTGRVWKKVWINRFLIGRTLGEFSWNRKFSKKKPKKKKK